MLTPIISYRILSSSLSQHKTTTTTTTTTTTARNIKESHPLPPNPSIVQHHDASCTSFLADILTCPYYSSLLSFLSFLLLSDVICGFLRCLWFFSIPSSRRVPAFFFFPSLSFSFIFLGPGSAGFLLGRPSSCPVPAPFLAGILAYLCFFLFLFLYSILVFVSFSFLFIHFPWSRECRLPSWPAQFLPSAGPVSGRHPDISLLHFASFSFFSCIIYLVFNLGFRFFFFPFHSFSLVQGVPASFLAGKPSSCPVPAPFLAGILAYLCFILLLSLSFLVLCCIQSWFSFLFLSFSLIPQ